MNEDDFQVDFSQDFKSSKFNEVLESAPLMLPRKFQKQFLHHIVEVLKKPEVEDNIKSKILNCIKLCFGIESRVKDFVDENLYLSLPYSNSVFSDYIFDIMYYIFVYFPQSINNKMVSIIKSLIKQNAEKCLVLFCIYGHSFNIVDNPWPVTDLLFSETSLFSQERFIPNYVSILSYLNRFSRTFKTNRSKHSWNQICTILASCNTDESILSCYKGLITISDTTTNHQIPIDSINNHITNKTFQDTILSLLLISDLTEKESTSIRFLRNLVCVCKTNSRCSIVLMKLCDNFNTAKSLLQNTDILIENLPTPECTLKIVLSICKHKELRDSLPKNANFVPFLISLINENIKNVISIICTLLRRLPLCDEFLLNLSEQEFFHKYFIHCKESFDENDKHSAFLLTGTLCHFCFINDMLFMSSWCIEEIENNGPLKDESRTIIQRLNRFSECQSFFKSKNITINSKRTKINTKD